VVVFIGLAPVGIGWVVIAAAVLLGAGVWAAGQAERVFARKDDGRIVIDEVVGQLLALAPLAALAPGLRRHPGLLAAGFLLFRLLDIWKPGPVRRAERAFQGGLGVMLDDVAAGLLAAAAMFALGAALPVTAS
jgi:phosphatidylglycerophosphatase A